MHLYDTFIIVKMVLKTKLPQTERQNEATV